MKYKSYARLWSELRWIFLLDFAAHHCVVANGPNCVKAFILMYDFLCCFAHCVKKVEFLSTCFICIASCLKCGVLALFEIDTFQIPFSASEGALFFFLLACSFCFCFLFCFVLFCLFLSLFSAMLNSSNLLNYMPTMIPSG